jgi:hypothetical protein
MERMMLCGWWKQGLVGVLFIVIFASAPVFAQDEFEEVSQPRCSGVEQDGVIVFGAEGGECVIRGELIRPNVSVMVERMEMNRDAMGRKTRFIPSIKNAVRRSPF